MVSFSGSLSFGQHICKKWCIPAYDCNIIGCHRTVSAFKALTVMICLDM